jgi:hypothetical protein
MDTSKRSLAKAVSWRITGSLDTFALSWLITGTLKNFTGVDSPYERPRYPEIHVRTESTSAIVAAKTIVSSVLHHILRGDENNGQG